MTIVIYQKHYLIFSIFLFSYIFKSFNAVAQETEEIKIKPSSTLALGFGTSHYLGDLAPYKTFYYSFSSNVRWSGSVNYQHYISPRFSARLSASIGEIFGDDATYGKNAQKLNKPFLRNLHFRNMLKEASVIMMYDLAAFKESNQKKWIPYIGGGFGMVGHTPQARGSHQDKSNGYSIKTNSSGKVTLQPWEYLTRYSQDDVSYKERRLVVPVIPIIVGVTYSINDKWDMSSEVGYRIVFSDYLDDVLATPYSEDPLNQFSYRADEDFNALTGKPRAEDFARALGIYNGDVYPSALSELGINKGEFRGSSFRDSYFFAQLLIRYYFNAGKKLADQKRKAFNK